MDDPVENYNLPLFCLLDILFTRGHHGLPNFPPGLWLDSPSEWDWIQYMCLSCPTADCGCLTVKPEFRSDVFNRVFFFKDNQGHTVWANMHGTLIFSYRIIPKKSHL